MGPTISWLFDVAGGSDDVAPAIPTKPVKEAYNDFAIPKDTARLLLNYRHPFGMIKFKDTITIIKQAKAFVPGKSKPAITGVSFNIQVISVIRHQKS